MGNKIRIKKNDENRVLITEVLPYETPIIFSNDGLYERLKSVESCSSIQRDIIKSIVMGEVSSSPVNSTIPYTYKIRKNSLEYRRLFLLHPFSQWKIRCFYSQYKNLITHYCSLSRSSIRAPSRVASSFYTKNSWQNINQYKAGNVSTITVDGYAKHAPSYFAYKGYDRLYKFFNSRDYLSLEKKFSTLMTLDVAKCFDSIYTHCLSWAIKDKEFTKRNVSISSTFAQDFDSTLRHGNHNETNGIAIGPEVSRVFAELIFQEIDVRTEKKLSKLKYGIDYELRRYVDDVFVFAKNEQIAKSVYSAYSDVLISFNLHSNTAKSSVYKRPFLTTKSRITYRAGLEANAFFDKFLESENLEELTPKKIHSRWKLAKSYIDSIKSLCSENNASYDELASFLLAVFFERIKKLINRKVTDADLKKQHNYADSILVILEVIYFLFSVSPSVSASYKLSTSIILIDRFSKKHLPDYLATISQQIYDLSSSMLVDRCEQSNEDNVDGFVNLEYLNVILAARELGENYLFPQELIEKLMLEGRPASYFTLISCFYYIRDGIQYSAIRKKLIKLASEKLLNRPGF